MTTRTGSEVMIDINVTRQQVVAEHAEALDTVAVADDKIGVSVLTGSGARVRRVVRNPVLLEMQQVLRTRTDLLVLDNVL